MKLKSKIKYLLLILLLIIPLGISGCGDNNPLPPDDQYDYTDLSVRDYIGKNGIVTAANPYAAKAGLDILKAGGNAFDALVAVSFALGVVEPNASGIGGGGIMVGYNASAGEFVSYNFREFVPIAGVPSAFPNRDADVDDGIKSSGVPTQVLGLLKTLDTYGTMSRQNVLAPAIKLANDGVLVTPELANAIRDNFSKIMRSKNDTKNVFAFEGIEPLGEGDLLIQKEYGKTLQKIADEGAKGFYEGTVADAIISVMNQQGGLITHDDLLYATENYPVAETPVQGTYRDYDVISVNTPSSGGIVLIEALNMLEVYGEISNLEHNSAEYINVLATALQLAYGDKRQYVGDRNFVNVPLNGLLSKAYAVDRWQKFVPNKAYLGRHQGDTDYGNPWPFDFEATPATVYQSVDYDEHYSTTTFSVADSFGNVASITQTINYFFGNGVVVPGCGFFLNNQLSSFSFTTSSASYIQPLKQPVSHIMPTIIMKDGDPFATIGSPGSMRIPSAVTQIVVNMIDYDMDIQTAINKPRFYCYAASNDDHSKVKKDLYIEKAISLEIRTKLDQMGYNVIPTGSKDIDLFFGGAQGIRFIIENNTLHGGADPRRDGKALGY